MIATGRVQTTGLTDRLGLWLYLVGALCEEPAWAPSDSDKRASAAVIAARELRIAPSIRFSEWYGVSRRAFLGPFIETIFAF